MFISDYQSENLVFLSAGLQTEIIGAFGSCAVPAGPQDLIAKMRPGVPVTICFPSPGWKVCARNGLMSSTDERRDPCRVEVCLARSVADTLAEEPALEAVTFDAGQQKISLATLGRADVERLTQRLTGKIQAAQSADAGRICSLLSGQGDCASLSLIHISEPTRLGMISYAV